jgi:hypothetical protein
VAGFRKNLIPRSMFSVFYKELNGMIIGALLFYLPPVAPPRTSLFIYTYKRLYQVLTGLSTKKYTKRAKKSGFCISQPRRVILQGPFP